MVRIILQIQKRANGIDLEAEIAGMPDEQQPLDIRLVIKTPIALRAWRCGQETDLLVITNGRYFHAASLGRFAYCNIVRHFFACSSSH